MKLIKKDLSLQLNDAYSTILIETFVDITHPAILKGKTNVLEKGNDVWRNAIYSLT